MSVINQVPAGTDGAISFFGGCAEFLGATDHQTILYGGTGSGKTVAGTTKLMLLSMLYPGAKSLFTRKSYTSLLKSGVETFEMVCRMNGWEIVTKKGNKPNQIWKLGEREPSEYRFPYAKSVRNGKTYEGVSRILLASLDNVKDELGAEYDYVYVNQPEQCTEEDWQFLVTRANGRRGHVPEAMLWGDPNPEHERHWIKLGGYELGAGDTPDMGRWRIIKSTFHDNPVIWDETLPGRCELTGKPGAFTEKGEEMVGKLIKSLSPVMAKRLILAEWASAEGMVFGEVWDRNRHYLSRARFEKEYGAIDDTWPRYWGIDFGIVDPFCVLFFAKHPVQELYVCYRYIYMTDRNINEHAETIRAVTYNEPRPTLIVADRNPQEINVLSQAIGLEIVTAKKGAGSRQAGIDVLSGMMKKDQLIFLSDGDVCVEEDYKLVAAKKPLGFHDEVDNYRYDPNRKTTNEEPIIGEDHAIDAAKYLFTHIKSDQRTVKFVWE